MTTHFQAIAPDGTILRRSSKSRTYTFMTAVLSTRTKKWGDGGWASRRDLAEANASRCRNYPQTYSAVKVLPVEVIDNKAATKITKSKITSEDVYVTKLAARLRKLGLRASKQGKRVWAEFATAHATFDRDVFNALPLGDDRRNYTRDWNRRQHNNNRICGLIARKYLADNGIDLSKEPVLKIYATRY